MWLTNNNVNGLKVLIPIVTQRFYTSQTQYCEFFFFLEQKLAILQYSFYYKCKYINYLILK